MSALIRAPARLDGPDPEAPGGSAAGVRRHDGEPFGDLDLEAGS